MKIKNDPIYAQPCLVDNYRGDGGVWAQRYAILYVKEIFVFHVERA